MLDLIPASYEDFERQAGQGNVVPVVRSVLADLLTPVGAFLRIAGDKPYAFLLESVEGGERIARYSFLGVDPEMIVRGCGSLTFVERNGKRETHAVRAIDFAREYFRGRVLARRPGLAPFAGGAVGYLAYDASRWFEPVLEKCETKPLDTETQPLQLATDALWMFYRTVIAFDRVRQQMEIVSVVLTEEAEGSKQRLRELYDAAVKRTAQIEEDLSKGVPLARTITKPVSESDGIESLESNWTRRDFEAGVRRIKEYITAGDCYQAVLSQRFPTAFAREPIATYRALPAIHPSPHMFFLRPGDETVIGASPAL